MCAIKTVKPFVVYNVCTMKAVKPFVANLQFVVILQFVYVMFVLLSF